MMWDDGSPDGVFSGWVDGLARATTMTYHGHVFKMMSDRTGELVTTLVMDRKRHMYFVEPVPEDTDDPNVFDPYMAAFAEREFMERYLKEHDTPWLSYYPRDPPVKTIWPAAYIGQTHVVTTPAGYFTCDPDSWSGNCSGGNELTLKLQVL